MDKYLAFAKAAKHREKSKDMIRAKYVKLVTDPNEKKLRLMDRRFTDYIYKVWSLDDAYTDDRIINLAFNARNESDEMELLRRQAIVTKYGIKIRHHMFKWPYIVNLPLGFEKPDEDFAMRTFASCFPKTHHLLWCFELMPILTGSFTPTTSFFHLDNYDIQNVLFKFLNHYTEPFDEGIRKALLFTSLTTAKPEITRRNIHNYLVDLDLKLPNNIRKMLSTGDRVEFFLYKRMSKNYRRLTAFKLGIEQYMS